MDSRTFLLISGQPSSLHSTPLLQQVLHGVVEAVGELVDELAAGDVHAVHDGVVLAAQDAVGATAGLQHLRLGVLLHDVAHLLQKPIQVLTTREKGQQENEWMDGWKEWVDKEQVFIIKRRGERAYESK